MNLPNMLTSLRFVMIPFYVVVFAKGHLIPAFLVVALAGVTDILDGYIARRSGQVTAVGMMLDPLADKLMFITVIVSLLLAGYISWGAAGAIFLRDIGMIAGGLFFHFRGKKTVPANWMGKLTTVLFYIGIMFVFFKAPFAEVYLWVVIAFSFVTSVMYIVLFQALNKMKQAELPPADAPTL
ncbi:CDP-alcohol phosphatidyltransferase family protein [Paenibacillus radicis (ex Gao et al. 2016)]|uniref:CDP-diacylglycerol--glycerol-3-phosphate 3-phosphatidyltransferase n=1 Tax=Paenibacillus radicis (ex Gao et al. 2016) TaxID=1737354 RepID=A0A917HMU1_9BACL|nr:CDP-alcohol phosphatidyltransferase family protein [Paenibacillus radicis (ex Gao et al. 2016)]GGG84281.1 CDP-diacylglycerol--glycerol-3-phosphate 3-phosphatidyltransferase [Paenibacillus radicis (ex Gao et al. 2016)]